MRGEMWDKRKVSNLKSIVPNLIKTQKENPKDEAINVGLTAPGRDA